MSANFYAYLYSHFKENLDDPCLVTPGGMTQSYADLDQLSGQFAAALVSAGVALGDRVVVQVDKSPAAVGLYLGVLRMGAVFVPLNTAYTASEVEYFLADTEAKVFVCRPEFRDVADAAAAAAKVPTVFALGADSSSDWLQAVTALTPDSSIAPRDEADLAAIIYTSGTTGLSKGAMIPQRALTANATALHQAWGFRPGDVLLHALPIFHLHGLFAALHTALLNASKIIFLPSFDTAVVKAQLAEATVLMGVPTFYSRLLNDATFGREDCAHMRVFICGSAPLTKAMSDQWATRTGHRILERYGMTEAGIITSNPVDGERIAGTVGFGVSDYQLRVCDAAGEELSRGEVGTLEVRGTCLFSGYWRKPDKTTEEVRDNGFFITGDLATMDADGRVSIVGRAKDLIISGGYNVYPKEIEAVLDSIEPIVESAVVGVPHHDLGEGVVAILVATQAPVDQALIQARLDAQLARFKHPRRFYWVDELPRNAMGKVQKNVLSEEYRHAYTK